MSKICHLTEDQWQAMARFREAWYAIGSQCGETKREVATTIISSLYRRLQKKPPAFLFVTSPLGALGAYSVLSHTLNTKGEQLRGPLRDALEEHLCKQLRGLVREQLDKPLYKQLMDTLRETLGTQLEEHLSDQLWEHLWEHMTDQLREQVWGFLRGSHEAYWVAFYVFMLQIGVQYPAIIHAHLTDWAHLVRACGWFLPYDQVCLVADRPVVQHVDAQRQLHCATGPAMAFADGLALWAWHGVRVPQVVIETSATMTIPQIQQERDPNIQQILVAQYGRERYLANTQVVLPSRTAQKEIF